MVYVLFISILIYITFVLLRTKKNITYLFISLI